MVRYPVLLEPDDNDTVLVSFPDFPEAHTFGDTREEALARAKDALATVIDGYIRSRRPLPRPSKVTQHAVQLPAAMSVKVDLYNAMTRARVTKAELARRLDVYQPQVDRLLDIRHSSRLDQLEAAAEALNSAFDISIAVCDARVETRQKPRRALWHPTAVRRRGRGSARMAADAVAGATTRRAPKKK